MNKSLGQTITKYRWPIGLVVWLLLTFLQIHGSSIGLYAHFLGVPDLDTALVGLNRTVQMDEWGAFTPFVFSQYFNGFSYISEIIRASQTDAALVYGVPCWDLITFFRPFLWGYLFLPPANGLAFFWTGRLIFLFLISYEMGKVLLKERKGFALAYACMLAFSQMVQFWFAENAFVELLIAGQGALLLWDRLGCCFSYKQALALTLGIAYCLVAYIFVMYPAWQTSFGYVFALLALWIAYTRWPRRKWTKKDTGLLGLGIIAIVIPLIHTMSLSWFTGQIISGSVYPGQRFITGGSLNVGDLFRYGFDYILPAMYFFQYSPLDTTTFLSFFPLGIVLAGLQYRQTRKWDGLVLVMLILSAVFYSFCLFPWPRFLAKITLLYAVPEVRLLPVVDFMQLLILLRVVAVGKPIVSFKLAASITLLYLAMLASTIGSLLTPSQLTISLAVIFMISFIVCLCLFKYTKYLLGIFVFLAIITGMTINPIARGTSSIYDTELAHQIGQISAVDQGKWLVDSAEKNASLGIFVLNNYPLFFGAPTINSSNMYVDWSRWDTFQLTKEQEQVLNRSCYMNVHITNEATKFTCPNEQLQVANIVNVDLDKHDLVLLDASYILSKRDLLAYSDNQVQFEICAQANGYTIYRIHYL